MADPIDAQLRLEQHPAVLTRNLLDGLLVLGINDGEPLHLTPPGDLLWEYLAQPITAADLATRLAERFGVAAEAVSTDITPVLAALLDAAAIRRLP